MFLSASCHINKRIERFRAPIIKIYCRRNGCGSTGRDQKKSRDCDNALHGSNTLWRNSIDEKAQVYENYKNSTVESRLPLGSPPAALRWPRKRPMALSRTPERRFSAAGLRRRFRRLSPGGGQALPATGVKWCCQSQVNARNSAGLCLSYCGQRE
jgi:hypothetical protein